MSDAEAIDVQTQTVDDVTIISPKGEIDLSQAPALRHYLSTVQASSPRKLVIDLGGVPYMDSSGVATLVEAMQKARSSGGQLILCCLQEKVRSIFEIARLDMVFTIVESPEQALTA